MEEWHMWVRSQTRTLTPPSVPHTGGLFMPLAYMFMPTLQTLTVNYALQHLGSTILNSGATYTQKIFNEVISLPFNFLSGKAGAEKAANKELDSAMDNYMKNGEKIGKDIFNSILESNQTMMILLVSILSLYFQYMGMTIMKEANTNYQSITTFIDPEDSGQGSSSTNVNSSFKKYIYSRYKRSSYYDNNAQGASEMANPFKYDPVRIVYNTLVGLNHALFFCVGGESDDPSHEILHWTKALFYWEILARLLRLHGLGPLQLASKMLLQDLWGKTKSKSK
jgi:hypothetical protein